ncbi:CRP-like cAMP-binding protein [Pedobacter africanus]|jgi:CRP-like cAMP-binding protein|uniref:CRP-like cAMP-binding protein n=1 Tax=Pedobacter africanus TaxID=151894 RepID=A0ACC6KZ84_9SPHI|nr:Crp/Fnr family transcriptional regulator [Pedobacter africanus]MDR6784381.1 CRP-like cAMP-binding protein [Pedobacter africanus]
MNLTDKLGLALQQFAGMSRQDFELSLPYWKIMDYKKGDFYNQQKSVCKYLGFVVEGVFRSYIIDAKTGEEKNIFLYSGNQFVVSFKSFIQQVPCDYHTTALTSARVVHIHIADLLRLYQQSHKWESFGRLLAQEAFNVAMARTESFLFQTPEERYLNLIKHHPDIFNAVPLYHISSYLGIQGPSLSRIRKRLSHR